ncbi:MAG: DUF1207 domain-containing protein [Acidobacteriota bacterium]
MCGLAGGLLALLLAAAPARAAEAGAPPASSADAWEPWFRWDVPPQGRRLVFLPEGDLFRPLLADPRQPRFHTTLQRWDTDHQDLTVGAVGLGKVYGLVRRRGARKGDGWQISLDGAVLAIFDLNRSSRDLLVSDFFFGIPFTWKHGAFSARIRPFHQSSHLGDDFLADPLPDFPVRQLNLSYEALEILGAWESKGVRLYGGGMHIFNTTTGFDREKLQAGLENYGVPLAGGWVQPVVAADLQSWQETGWDVDISIKTGLRIRSPSRGTGRGLQVLLEYYNGHAPQGQFIDLRVRYIGLGLTFSM